MFVHLTFGSDCNYWSNTGAHYENGEFEGVTVCTYSVSMLAWNRTTVQHLPSPAKLAQLRTGLHPLLQ